MWSHTLTLRKVLPSIGQNIGVVTFSSTYEDMSMIFSKWQTPLVKSLCYFDIKFCDSILSKLFGNFSKLFSIPFQAQSRTYHLELKLQSFAKKSATFSETRWQDYFYSIWQVAKIKICQITYKICQNT